MISKRVLKELINIRLKDAQALFKTRRYQASIYLSGYSIEIALKLRICRMFSFNKGFPETKSEFSDYKNPSSKGNVAIAIKELKEIRHHGLTKLIIYSGVETRIKQAYLNEWNLIAGWDPKIRYEISKTRKADAYSWLSSVQVLINAFSS